MMICCCFLLVDWGRYISEGLVSSSVEGPVDATQPFKKRLQDSKTSLVE